MVLDVFCAVLLSGYQPSRRSLVCRSARLKGNFRSMLVLL